MTKYKSTKVQKVHKYKSTHNSAIFELQTKNFAWKLIWTVKPNDKVQKYKNTKNAKNANMQKTAKT